MMLHYAGEAVFEVTEAVGVLPVNNFAEIKTNSPHISHQCGMKITKHVFSFRHAQQKVGEPLPASCEITTITKNCNFEYKNRWIK